MNVESNLLSKDDIFLDKNFGDTDAYYKEICTHLLQEGKIDSNYLNSIETREKKFPTGLNTGKICVAIPHTDYQHSKTTQLVITTLGKPIYFKQMDDPSKSCPVTIIIQILFDSPEKQLILLKELMKMIQNQKFLNKVMDAKDINTIISLFKKGK